MRCLALLVALLPLCASFSNATLELERDLEHRRLKGTRTPAQRIAEGEKALLALRSKITQLYGVSEKVMTQDTKYYSKENDKKVSLTVVHLFRAYYSHLTPTTRFSTACATAVASDCTRGEICGERWGHE